MKWLKELKRFIPVIKKFNRGLSYYANSRKLKFTFEIEVLTYEMRDHEIFKNNPYLKNGLSENFLNKKILHINLKFSKKGYNIYIGEYKLYKIFNYSNRDLKKQIKNLPTW